MLPRVHTALSLAQSNVDTVLIHDANAMPLSHSILILTAVDILSHNSSQANLMRSEMHFALAKIFEADRDNAYTKYTFRFLSTGRTGHSATERCTTLFHSSGTSTSLSPRTKSDTPLMDVMEKYIKYILLQQYAQQLFALFCFYMCIYELEVRNYN